jgi:hypothetical protein
VLDQIEDQDSIVFVAIDRLARVNLSYDLVVGSLKHDPERLLDAHRFA